MTARAAAGPAVIGLRGGLRMAVTGRTGLRGGPTTSAAATGLTGQVGQLVLAPGPTVPEPAAEPASLVATRGPATACGTSAPAPVPSAWTSLTASLPSTWILRQWRNCGRCLAT
jgi:hypothetical protein